MQAFKNETEQEKDKLIANKQTIKANLIIIKILRFCGLFIKFPNIC